MEPNFLAFAVLLGSIAGLLIGSTGIGGVILVPALVYVAGIPVHTAIATTMLSFLISGVIGTIAYARRGSIRWRLAGRLCLAAAPAAFIGALIARSMPAWLIETTIALLAIVSGLNALLGRTVGREPSDRIEPSGPVIAATGSVTGILSALSGTGGPLVLVPILLSLKLPLLTSVGLAQVVQLPVAAFASAGYTVGDLPPLQLGFVLGIGIAFGTWIGAHTAHVIPQRLLQTAIAALLLIVGVSILTGIAVAGQVGN